MPAPSRSTASGWIDANLASLATVLEPAAERLGGQRRPARGAIAGGVLAIEAGAVSGFLAGRVLGQYEFPVLEPDKPARLLFVAPNLAHAANALDAPDRPAAALGRAARDDARAAVRRRAVAARAPGRRCCASCSARSSSTRAACSVCPMSQTCASSFERVREDGLAMVVVGAGRRETLDRVQAFMAVLEGYAEHVMDAVGADRARRPARRCARRSAAAAATAPAC